MCDLYLASRSRRRRELLWQIGVDHQVVTVEVPEVYGQGETPERYVQRLAVEKSVAGWRYCWDAGLPLRPVLGADTVGELDGHILEKPGDQAHAVEMLLSMSGRQHRVLSAVALTSAVRQEVRISESRVTFRPIDSDEANAYWATGEAADKAGGYAIQGMGAVFVEHLEGSYSGVVGLSLWHTQQLLQDFGVPCWKRLPAEGRNEI